MATGATGQLGLALPVQGELSGTWGDTVNNGITQYTNIAIAGTLSFVGDGTVTLANTTGDATASNIGSTTAQYMVIRITGTLTGTKSIIGPSYSKIYLIDNAATGGAVYFFCSGQVTPVTIAAGESAFVYFNGTDYIKVTSDLILGGYTTTVTAAGTTTLTSASTPTQFFTGSTTQTVVLPVAATLILGAAFTIHNNSTGDLTINSSGGNLVATITPSTTFTFTCILTSGTTAASWDSDVTGFTSILPIARGGTGTSSTTFVNAATNVTGLLPVANGGTGTATPALVQGTGVTISGSWPNQTINATGTGGTVTAVSVSSANGFAGTSSGGTTPALTLSTSITGVLKGNGTSISAATAGTDYVVPGGALGTPSSGTLTNCTFPTLNQNTTGTAANVTGTVAVANGGTGQTSYTNGQLLIGNSTGNTLTKATLTQGTGITITNAAGAITIAASSSGGVTSIATTGGVSGGTITSTGTISLNTDNAGGIGAYCLARIVSSGGGGSNGAAISSGFLRAAGSQGPGGGNTWVELSSNSMSGTWRQMSCGTVDAYAAGSGIFQRIS